MSLNLFSKEICNHLINYIREKSPSPKGGKGGRKILDLKLFSLYKNKACIPKIMSLNLFSMEICNHLIYYIRENTPPTPTGGKGGVRKILDLKLFSIHKNRLVYQKSCL